MDVETALAVSGKIPGRRQLPKEEQVSVERLVSQGEGEPNYVVVYRVPKVVGWGRWRRLKTIAEEEGVALLFLPLGDGGVGQVVRFQGGQNCHIQEGLRG